MDYKIAKSIYELDEAEWDAVVSDDLPMSHRGHRIQERARINYHPLYLLIKDSQGPLAVAVFNLADRFGRSGLIEAFLRRLTLTVRSPFSMYSCSVTARPGRSLADVLPLVERRIDALCFQKQRVMVAVNNVRTADLPLWKQYGYQAVPHSPNAMIDLPETYAEYLAALPKKDRCEVYRMCRKAESTHVRFTCGGIDGDAETLHRLMAAVYEKNKIADMPMVYGADFFDVLEHELPNDHHVLRAYVGDQLAGASVMITYGSKMWWPMLGFNYELSRASNLYFVMMDEVIRWAIARGIRWIDAGVTNMEIKKGRGYYPHERWLCYRAYPGVLNWGLKTAMGLLHRGQAVSRHGEVSEPSKVAL